jgi:HD-GYP domain-containing protein (c-di-GMP phosphodiesterase class II)
MPYSPLSSVRARIRLGSPVPFNIRGHDHRLLLARGQIIRDEEQLEAMFERGAVVDSDEVKSPRDEVVEAPVESLPGLWSGCIDRVGRTLKAPTLPEFARSLEEAAEPVLALVERDPDLAIFQVVRQDAGSRNTYGVAHSVHTAIASYLVAQRLGWDPAAIERVFKAALTMNLAMLELQGRLATQLTPLTAAQREAIHDHPSRSAELLEASGVQDADWLAAVRNHHEVPGGHGYPRACQDVDDMASLLRRVDVYTAKLSPRISRKAIPANQAGRELFLKDAQHPMAAAVVKEFGVYPPGCFVQLECGEVGVVIKRGPNANTPLVAALTARNGDALMEPARRNTDHRGYAVVNVVPESALRVRVSPEKLVVLATR